MLVLYNLKSLQYLLQTEDVDAVTITHSCSKMTNEFKMSKYLTFKDDYLHIEGVCVKQLQEDLANIFSESSPTFVYSENQLRDNIASYFNAMRGIPHILAYAFKANSNLAVLKMMADAGCGAVTVNGHEIELALRAGIAPDMVVFNGNGKRRWEIELAVQSGCFINVDSAFDLRHILQAARDAQKAVRILVRINPAIDPVSIGI